MWCMWESVWSCVHTEKCSACFHEDRSLFTVVWVWEVSMQMGMQMWWIALCALGSLNWQSQDIFALWFSSTFLVTTNTSCCIWIYNFCVNLFSFSAVELPIVTELNYQWWTGEPAMLFWWSIFGHVLSHAIFTSKTLGWLYFIFSQVKILKTRKT